MDWLIIREGIQPGENGLSVYFSAYCKPSGQPPIQFTFAVDYAYGATQAVKKTAILNAAKAVYTGITGVSDFAGMRVEIMGANTL